MKKKTILIGVLIAVLILGGLTALTIYNGKWSHTSDFVIEDGVLTKYTGDAPYVSIPPSVTQIGSFVFFNHTEIRTVKMTDSVTNIAQAAFYGCTNLSSIKLSNAVTYIDDGAFGECDSLDSFTVPASVQFIIEGAFYGSDSLTAFKVEDGNTVFTAVDGVLYTADRSALVAYPAGRADAEYTVCAETDYLASWSFFGASNLKTVTIPDSLTRIGEETFRSSAVSAVTLPSALTEFGSGAFYGCTGLRSVSVPANIVELPNNLFTECTGLETVELPEGLTSIAQYVFSGCTALSSVNLPSTLTLLSDNSFIGCTSLTLHLTEGSLFTEYAEANGFDYVID